MIQKLTFKNNFGSAIAPPSAADSPMGGCYTVISWIFVRINLEKYLSPKYYQIYTFMYLFYDLIFLLLFKLQCITLNKVMFTFTHRKKSRILR